MSGLTLTGFKNWQTAASMLAAVVFIIAQILVVAHAAKYGDGPHDHGGQTCVLSVASPAGEKFIAAATVFAMAVFMLWRVSNQVAQSERAHILVRTSRPRGPPNR